MSSGLKFEAKIYWFVSVSSVLEAFFDGMNK